MKTKIISLMVMLCTCIGMQAQNEVDTKLVIAQDDMKLKKYREATRSLHWLLTNVPEKSNSIYIMAYKAYEKAAEQTEDKAEKAILLDSMMLTYRLKEAQFGLTDLEKNNYAYRFYKYYKKDDSKLEAALKAYEEVFKSPETVINNNLVTYMSFIRAQQSKTQSYSVKDLIGLNSTINGVIDLKLKNGEDPKKMDRYSQVINKMFLETVKPVLNCEAIDVLAADIPNQDINYTKMIFSWSLEFSCTDTDFFLQSAEILANDEDTATPGIIEIVARNAAANEDYEKAITYYKKAIPKWETDDKKARSYMSLAKVYQLNKNKPEARTAAFKAAEIESSEAAAAYSFVANLYMGSFDDCAEGYRQVEDRAIFMAAYDLFEKAGDTVGMQNAKEQFPTKTQAFSEEYEEDNMILDVGCWINVKTKLRTRKSN